MRPAGPAVSQRQRWLRLAGQLLSITVLLAVWQLLDGWFADGNTPVLLWLLTLLVAAMLAGICFRLAKRPTDTQ